MKGPLDEQLRLFQTQDEGLLDLALKSSSILTQIGEKEEPMPEFDEEDGPNQRYFYLDRKIGIEIRSYLGGEGEETISINKGDRHGKTLFRGTIWDGDGNPVLEGIDYEPGPWERIINGLYESSRKAA